MPEEEHTFKIGKRCADALQLHESSMTDYESLHGEPLENAKVIRGLALSDLV